MKNIPTGAQEAVLQQEIEKLVRVKRVELFEDIGEAIVELESVAVRSLNTRTIPGID